MPNASRNVGSAAHLARKRDASEEDLAVSARDETNLDVTKANERAAGGDTDELFLLQTFRATPRTRGLGPDELRVRELGDARCVGRMIVVAVPAQNGI